MNESLSTTNSTLWERLVETQAQSSAAFRAFTAAGVHHVAPIGKGLRTPGLQRQVALDVIPYLSLDEKKELFPDLIQAARAAHGPVGAVREIILSLPGDWVLAHVEAEVDAILQSEEYDDYWMFLELYQDLDRDLARKLAHRAAAHVDAEIRELGEDWLEKLVAPDRALADQN